jgi:endonuclease-3 related protein
MKKTPTVPQLYDIYERLAARYGRQHWWPADTPFEVMVGAILTQQTTWSSAEKAMLRINQAGALSPAGLRCLRDAELAALIHPCGCHNTKAKKLKALADWLRRDYQDDLKRLFESGTVADLRNALLGVYGIGPETADDIILYGARRPVFVIDNYTRRIMERLGVRPERDRYDSWQNLFMSNLPPDVKLYSEYHALIIQLGKYVCHTRRPLCDECCLARLCVYGQAGAG